MNKEKEGLRQNATNETSICAEHTIDISKHKVFGSYTTESKSKRGKKRTAQLHLDSLTKVNPIHTHGLGIWGNARVVFGVRVDEKLAKAFTKVSKVVFGSTCAAIEPYMATIVSSYQTKTLDKIIGVNPSITPNISIGEIRIERNLRERRKVVVEKDIHTHIEKTVETIREAGRKCVSDPAIDYSKLSLAELERRYSIAVKQNRMGLQTVLAFEFKRRNLNVPQIGDSFSPNLFGVKPREKETSL